MFLIILVLAQISDNSRLDDKYRICLLISLSRNLSTSNLNISTYFKDEIYQRVEVLNASTEPSEDRLMAKMISGAVHDPSILRVVIQATRIQSDNIIYQSKVTFLLFAI